MHFNWHMDSDPAVTDDHVSMSRHVAFVYHTILLHCLLIRYIVEFEHYFVTLVLA
jgi:hypothetical protein